MIKLLHDNILIKEIKEEEKFGIKSDKLSFKAEVIQSNQPHIYVGDIVYLSINTGIKYGYFIIVKPYEILGKNSSEDVKQN